MNKYRNGTVLYLKSDLSLYPLHVVFILQVKVNQCMNGAVSCLISDSWSDVRNDAIVNYMAVSPLHSLFLESVATGQISHDHKFIAEDLARVIRRYDTTDFAGAVTDNTATNKKAWSLLKQWFPSRYFQGCCSHGIHLFVKDVFAATRTKKAGDIEATYPINYPFEVMLDFIAACKDVVKYFHNHHVAKAQLRDLQLTEKARMLVRPAPTRWGTIQGMCSTLLESERHLHAIVSGRDFVVGSAAQKAEKLRVKNTVIHDDFIPNLRKALAILGPLDCLIVKYQSDKVPISEVIPDFKSIVIKYEKLCRSEIIDQAEYDYLVFLTNYRFEFMSSEAHGLSCILDPRYLGSYLSPATRLELEDILVNTPIDDDDPGDDERKEKLFVQMTEYLIAAAQEKETNSFRYKMLMKGSKTPRQYWLTDGTQWPDLQKIAIKLFSMATSSAASERNFSTMGFIHSKLRNKLSPSTVEKLVYIKCNISAFYTQQLCEESDDDHSV